MQNYLTLDRIAREKRMPHERCHSQAAKLTMNHDRESDINIRAAGMKADRSLSRIDSAKENINITIEAYKEWLRSFDMTCKRVALREVKKSGNPCLLKFPPINKSEAINM